MACSAFPGDKVEESQIVLLLDAHRIDSRTTENQRLDISRRRDRLQLQINGLVQTAATFVGADWDSGLDACDHGDSGSDARCFPCHFSLFLYLLP